MDKYEKMARELCKRKNINPDAEFLNDPRACGSFAGKMVWESYASEFKKFDEMIGVMNDLGEHMTA